jgi:intracellular multiplication protein IcmO
LIDLENRMERFKHLLESKAVIFGDAHEESEEVTIIAREMNKESQVNPIEKGVTALLAFHNRNDMPELEAETLTADVGTVEDDFSAFTGISYQPPVARAEPRRAEPATQEVENGHLNLFSKVLLPEKVKTLVGPATFENFSMPLVSKALIKDKVELLERVMGKTGSQANTITNEIIKDMLMATDYPPDITGLLQDITTVTATAKDITDFLTSLQSTSAED